MTVHPGPRRPSLFVFLSRLVTQRAMIALMTRRELNTRYAGAAAGAVWAVLNPLCTILIYWFVFSYGLKVSPMGDTPFIVAYLAGYLPWLLFSEALGGSCACVVANPHLVKKVVFPVEILPVVHFSAGLAVHAALLPAYCVILLLNGYSLSFHMLQALYYLPGLWLLATGLSWIAAAFTVFYRDTQQILGLVLNVWFWLTPIVWPLEMLPETPRRILALNPLNYVVEGYRHAFISHEPIWTAPWGTAFFWCAAIGVFALGGLVFKRLKPEFADVL